MVASLLWKLMWCLLIPGKPVLREGAFRSVPAQGLLDPGFWTAWYFKKQGLSFHFWGVFKGNKNRVCFGSPLDNLGQHSKDDFSCLAKRKRHKPCEKFSFNLYMYFYMLNYLHCRSLGGKQTMLWFPLGFIVIILLPPFSSYTDLCSPSQRRPHPPFPIRSFVFYLHFFSTREHFSLLSDPVP